MRQLRTIGVGLLSLGVVLQLPGCRVNRIWSGIEVQTDGTLKLAAEDPRCGCLSVVNATAEDVRLRAIQRDQLLGEATLKAGERQRFRFDWGGPEVDDYYEVMVTTPEGRELDADDVLEVEDRPRWVECEVASCEFGDLHMETVGREP